MGREGQKHGAEVRKLLITATAVALAGCSTTPAQLEEKSQPSVQAFAENYQEIYRRVSGPAKRCIAANVGPYASMAVDADLLPDLGYGQITVSLINWGTRNYYVSAKVEKLPKGSQMTVRAGNTLGADKMIQNFQRWASGDDSC